MTQQLENVSAYINSNNSKQGHGYLIRDYGFSDPVIDEMQKLILARLSSVSRDPLVFSNYTRPAEAINN